MLSFPVESLTPHVLAHHVPAFKTLVPSHNYALLLLKCTKPRLCFAGDISSQDSSGCGELRRFWTCNCCSCRLRNSRTRPSSWASKVINSASICLTCTVRCCQRIQMSGNLLLLVQCAANTTPFVSSFLHLTLSLNLFICSCLSASQDASSASRDFISSSDARSNAS